MLKTSSATVQSTPSAVVSHYGTVHQTPKGYSDRLYNEDLAPLVAGKDRTNRQDWNWYNILRFGCPMCTVSAVMCLQAVCLRWGFKVGKCCWH